MVYKDLLLRKVTVEIAATMIYSISWYLTVIKVCKKLLNCIEFDQIKCSICPKKTISMLRTKFSTHTFCDLSSCPSANGKIIQKIGQFHGKMDASIAEHRLICIDIQPQLHQSHLFFFFSKERRLFLEPEHYAKYTWTYAQ